jgi:mycofactocin system FadH/OYE family oxidoreductase 1
VTERPLLTDTIAIGSRTAPSRVVFGPHETNLARGRAISPHHVAYYARRAAGGAGVIITETASVGPDDWPYERAPLAAACADAWGAVADACRPHHPVVLAGIGHAGGQGSSAYSQSVLWAPSRVADVVSREPPAPLDQSGIATVVGAFAEAARLAVASGLDGVEVDAGAWSLLRQFQSGLTNQRQDGYGDDRLRFTRDVLAAVRGAIGANRILALRLSCDELAPWGGITPEAAAETVAALAATLDLLTVIRAGPYSTSAYRPDAHTPPATNLDLCRAMRDAAGGVPVVLQGSVTDPGTAARALSDGYADLVEMTRAQIAEARLVGLLRAGHPEQARPCLLCNQTCQVRDNRNPIVTCVGDPRSGHETTDIDPDPDSPAPGPAGPAVLIVGGGPAGLECARVLAGAGRRVGVAERTGVLGGALAAAAVGPGRTRLRLITDWLAAECARLGVEVALGVTVDGKAVTAAQADGWEVVLATGSRPFPERYGRVPADLAVVDALALLREGTGRLPDGPVVIDDPVGGPIGVGVAEWLAATTDRAVTLVSPDPVAGTLLARSGDLADANVRLQQAGVARRLRSRLISLGRDGVAGEDVWTGEPFDLPAGVLIDCGHRLPDDELYLALGDPRTLRAGDCVAPRSVHEAILEGRRAALALLAAAPSPPPLRTPSPAPASPAPGAPAAPIGLST